MKNKRDIYIDFVERIVAQFNSAGNLIYSTLDGYIKIKSYHDGNPRLKMTLKNDVDLDDFNLHQCVSESEFEFNKTLELQVPIGEHIIMNYRLSRQFVPPFRVYTFLQMENKYKISLDVKIKSNLPENSNSTDVVVKFNVGQSASSVHFDK